MTTFCFKVWSFGIVIIELLQNGRQPYEGMSNPSVMTLVLSGRSHPQITKCPDRLYEVLKACFDVYPENRPKFGSLVSDLRSYCEEVRANAIWGPAPPTAPRNVSVRREGIVPLHEGADKSNVHYVDFDRIARESAEEVRRQSTELSNASESGYSMHNDAAAGSFTYEGRSVVPETSESDYSVHNDVAAGAFVYAGRTTGTSATGFVSPLDAEWSGQSYDEYPGSRRSLGNPRSISDGQQPQQRASRRASIGDGDIMNEHGHIVNRYVSLEFPAGTYDPSELRQHTSLPNMYENHRPIPRSSSVPSSMYQSSQTAAIWRMPSNFDVKPGSSDGSGVGIVAPHVQREASMDSIPFASLMINRASNGAMPFDTGPSNVATRRTPSNYGVAYTPGVPAGAGAGRGAGAGAGAGARAGAGRGAGAGAAAAATIQSLASMVAHSVTNEGVFSQSTDILNGSSPDIAFPRGMGSDTSRPSLQANAVSASATGGNAAAQHRTGTTNHPDGRIGANDLSQSLNLPDRRPLPPAVARRSTLQNLKIHPLKNSPPRSRTHASPIARAGVSEPYAAVENLALAGDGDSQHVYCAAKQVESRPQPAGRRTPSDEGGTGSSVNQVNIVDTVTGRTMVFTLSQTTEL